jgi:predicted nucleotidyltransferase
VPFVLDDRQRAVVAGIAERRGEGLLGLVLSGSSARGMATDRSDLDVYVVLTEDAAQGQQTSHSVELDEIPKTVAELETVAPFGSDGWWYRWSFAWAQVLRDDTGGRITDAVRRQAVLDDAEQRCVLLDSSRLDGWVNFAYRSLKSHRDGRLLEARLDAAESVPWLLDVVFCLAGRVRPYNKYLPWELREHPLAVTEWCAEDLLSDLERMLAGDPEALRRTFAVLDREVRAWDAQNGGTDCGDLVDEWGEELALFQRP